MKGFAPILNGQVGDVMRQWRMRAVTIIYYVALAVTLPAIISTTISAVKIGSWFSLIIVYAFYLLLACMAIFKNLDYRLRGWSLIIAGYAMAVTTLVVTGLEGSGRVYLMALPVLGFILTGTSGGWIAAGLSILIYGTFTGLSESWLAPYPDRLDALVWINNGLVMVMLMVFIVVLLIRMYRFLLSSLAAEQKLAVELSQTYDATLEGWAKALELRDIETAGHCHRVSDISRRLAEDNSTWTIDMTDLHRGSLLHDIGKMGIPDNILLKPGKLTADEFKKIQEHTTYAYELLSHIPYLKNALDIPYCHHEKWDGTGYPRRLKGTEIPLAARIFSVVDVYDALISDRPYRPAWPDDKALEYIKEKAGIDFDPAVVELFTKLADKDASLFANIKKHLHEPE
ncbi:MAG: HD domain-containing protein [Chloroflexi bacterium]|nr:HD domain-containing protein [Chloroflexota bacterium]